MRPLKLRLISDWEIPSATDGIKPMGERRSQWLKEMQVSVCLDVGANTGQYGLGVLANGFDGRLVSFEPLMYEYEDLSRQAKRHSCWDTRNFALGDFNGEAEINIAGNSQSSSLLPMNKRHADSAPSSKYIGKQVVEVARLDSLWKSIVSDTDRAWLKIDVQGAEASVLDGLGIFPEQLCAVELELSLVDLYEGQPSMSALLNRLSDAGYVLAALEDVFWDSNTLETLQINGIFLRRFHSEHPST